MRYIRPVVLFVLLALVSTAGAQAFGPSFSPSGVHADLQLTCSPQITSSSLAKD